MVFEKRAQLSTLVSGVELDCADKPYTTSRKQSSLVTHKVRSEEMVHRR